MECGYIILFVFIIPVFSYFFQSSVGSKFLHAGRRFYLCLCCVLKMSLKMQSCDDILEPKLDELVHQLRMMSQNWEASWIIDQLMSRLSSLSSPDDLFNFFSDIRGEFINLNIVSP